MEASILRKDIKLVITDLDGTLIDHKQQIHPRNLQALKDLKTAGIMVAPATGRGKRSAEGVTQGFTFSEYLICFQGAALFQGENTLWHQPLGEAALYIELLREHKEVNVGVYTKHAPGVEDLSVFAPYYAEAADYLVKQGGIRVTGEKILEIASRDLTKVVYFGKLQDLLDIQGIWCKQDKSKHIVLSSDYTLDLTHENAKKSVAAKHLAKILGFSMAEVLALGDNYNDADLLEAAGFGIAMKEAPSKVKERADAVTGKVTEGGFAEAIYKYVL